MFKTVKGSLVRSEGVEWILFLTFKAFISLSLSKADWMKGSWGGLATPKTGCGLSFEFSLHMCHSSYYEYLSFQSIYSHELLQKSSLNSSVLESFLKKLQYALFFGGVSLIYNYISNTAVTTFPP